MQGRELGCSSFSSSFSELRTRGFDLAQRQRRLHGKAHAKRAVFWGCSRRRQKAAATGGASMQSMALAAAAQACRMDAWAAPMRPCRQAARAAGAHAGGMRGTATHVCTDEVHQARLLENSTRVIKVQRHRRRLLRRGPRAAGAAGCGGSGSGGITAGAGGRGARGARGCAGCAPGALVLRWRGCGCSVWLLSDRATGAAVLQAATGGLLAPRGCMLAGAGLRAAGLRGGGTRGFFCARRWRASLRAPAPRGCGATRPPLRAPGRPPATRGAGDLILRAPCPEGRREPGSVRALWASAWSDCPAGESFHYMGHDGTNAAICIWAEAGAERACSCQRRVLTLLLRPSPPPPLLRQARRSGGLAGAAARCGEQLGTDQVRCTSAAARQAQSKRSRRGHVIRSTRRPNTVGDQPPSADVICVWACYRRAFCVFVGH